MEIPSSIRQGLAQRYDLTGVLGTGGMATVYRATDLRHHREVAVKVMRPELTASFAVDRFLKEISISAGLHHPHILTLIDSGEVDGIPYYVMPLVDGESLRLLMDRLGPQSLEETLGVVTEVADALDYAHRRGVIHRDIKPENILLADGHAVVADFGIAKAITSAGGATLTKTGMPVGTPGYMSPEQAAGLPDLDTRSDVFSLACVCFEMLVGEPPGMWPNGDDQRSGHFQRATTHRARLDALPRPVEAALVHAMAIDPGARPTSPSAFVRALQRRTDQASTRRYGRNEVEQIIRDAAEIEAQPTVDPAVTIGSVEALAADVGIAPARIQEAAHALDRTDIALRPGGVLGLQPQLQVERVVDGEMSSEVYASVLEEIRVALGETGTLAETLGDSLVWNSPTGGTGRKARVMVSPSGGKTRIRIQDDDGEPGSGFVMAPIVTISVVLIGITGAIVNDATGSNLWGLIAAFGVSSSFFGTTWLIARRSFRRRMTERATQLDQLMRRLTGMVRTAPSSTDD